MLRCVTQHALLSNQANPQNVHCKESRVQLKNYGTPWSLDLHPNSFIYPLVVPSHGNSMVNFAYDQSLHMLQKDIDGIYVRLGQLSVQNVVVEGSWIKWETGTTSPQQGIELALLGPCHGEGCGNHSRMKGATLPLAGVSGLLLQGAGPATPEPVRDDNSSTWLLVLNVHGFFDPLWEHNPFANITDPRCSRTTDPNMALGSRFN